MAYLTEGALPAEWGAGNFLVLKFSDFDENATSVKVGLSPSQGSGLVETLTDPDKNGAFKITNKDTQKLMVVSSDGNAEHVKTQVFDLSGLTVVTATSA